MQLNSNGIPCNVATTPRAESMKQVKTIKFTENRFKHFSELTGIENGMVVHIQVPTATKQFKQALKDGYELVMQWEKPKIQF